MLLFSTYDYQSLPTASAMASTSKGTAKFRGTQYPRLANPLPTTIVPLNIVNKLDNEETNISSGDVSDSSSTSPTGKQRRTSISPPPSEEIRVAPVYWDYSHICSTHLYRLSKWNLGAKIMDTSSIAGPGQATSSKAFKSDFDLEDWKDLRDLATKAKKTYDDHDFSASIPILRAVAHECHRCLKLHPDPSVVFAAPLHKKKPEPPPAPVPLLPLPIGEWYNDPQDIAARRSQGRPFMVLPPLSELEPTEMECSCIDLPTAFHTLLGTTLFMFGCIIDSDASLALEGEPKTPTPYWFAAIDVFESGESLPIRSSSVLPKCLPEDWRMAANWGRTFVKVATELLKRRKENPALREPPPMPDYSNFEVPQPSIPTPYRTYTADEPNWPRSSLFATIGFLRPSFSQRLLLIKLNPDEIMGFAEDHLTRAMFHMPHPRNVITAKYPYLPSASSAPTPPIDSEIERNGPDRPQEIYTMASEMLFAAENSETPGSRFRWARWADGVISTVKIAPNMNPLRFLDLRAKCNLVMGSAKMEELLADWDYPSVLDTDDAEDARQYFKKASTFVKQLINSIEEDIKKTSEMEKNLGMKFDSDNGEGGSGNTLELVHDENDLYRMKILRSEALIELGNLTADSKAREELYAEAKRVGGPKIVLGDEGPDLDETGESIYGEDRMDETE